MESSTEKSKIMTFCSKDPVSSKICMNNIVLERVNQFNYMGSGFSYSADLGVSKNI